MSNHLNTYIKIKKKLLLLYLIFHLIKMKKMKLKFSEQVFPSQNSTDMWQISKKNQKI